MRILLQKRKKNRKSKIKKPKNEAQRQNQKTKNILNVYFLLHITPIPQGL
jgi:hypothetical protein